MTGRNPYLLVFILSCSAALVAQSSDACRNRTLLASAVDLDGNTIRSLGTPAFHLKIAKSAPELVHSDYKLEPHRIVILLDTSGSMAAGKNKWAVARTAAQEMLSMTPPQVSLALVSYGEKTDKVLGFSGDRSLALDWLAANSSRENKVIKGRTALLDAIMATLSELQPYHVGDSIYVITDGGDNVSKIEASKVKKALLTAGVRLFLFRLDSGWFTQEEQIGLDEIVALAVDSGGHVSGIAGRMPAGGDIFEPYYEMDDRTRESIKNMTRLANNLIHGTYLLSFELSQNLSMQKWSGVSLEVVDDHGKRRKDVKLLAFPRRLSPCTPEKGPS